MKALLDLILRLFGKEPSIESIVSPMGKIVRNLEVYAERQSSLAADREDRGVQLLTESKKASKECDAALALAGNYKGLIGA